MPSTKNNKKKVNWKATQKVLLLFCIGAAMASFGGSRRNLRNQKENVLDQQTRNSIYQLIKDNEGLHFRKICRMLNKKMGVVQYHVSVLEKHGLIRSIRDGRYKCFFATTAPGQMAIAPELRNPERDALRQTIITSLRRKTPQILITYLAKEHTASHQKLSTIAKVSPQAITFHTQRLQNFGIITAQKEGRQKYYSLTPIAVDILNDIL